MRKPHRSRVCASAAFRFLVAYIALSSAGIGTTRAEIIITENFGSASASFSGTSLPSQSDTQTFGRFGGVAVAELDLPHIGFSRAAQTGSGLNAVTKALVPEDILNFRFDANTGIEWRIENIGKWGVTLRGDGSSVVADMHGVGTIFDLHDPLDLGVPTLSPVTVTATEAMVSIAPFTATADLGAVFSGNSALISYSMVASVSGSGLNGDPFNLAVNSGSIISVRGAEVPAPLPEPPALSPQCGRAALLLLFVRRRTLSRPSGLIA